MSDNELAGATLASDPDTGWESERPTKVRYRVLAAASSLAVITYIHRVGFATASAELSRILHLTDTHLGWLMAAFMLGYGLFEMPWGFLADKLGSRNVLAAIILGGSALTASLALVGFLPGQITLVVAVLVLLRFAFGMFQAGTFPALSRMTADWLPTTERGRAQGVVWMSSRLGGALAPFVIVVLFRTMDDWKAPLVLVAGLGLFWCAIFWPWFRNRPEEMPQVNRVECKLIAAGRAAGASHPHGDVPWGRMFRSTSVWSLWLMYGFLGLSGNFFLTLLPTYLRNHRHLDSYTTGLLTSLPFAFGVVGCMLGGWISDLVTRHCGRRFGRRLVGLAGMAVAGLAIVAVPFVEEVGTMGLLLVLTFFGNDLSMAPAWAAAADIGERHAGVLSGAMNMLGSFFAGAAAIVIGRLFDAGDLHAPFFLLATSYALAVLCWIGVDVRRTLADAH